MTSQSVAHRPVDTPRASAPLGAWALGHQSDERIAIIAKALNLFDGASPRTATDDTVRTQVATRAYVASRFDGPYAPADAVARHRAVEAAQATAAHDAGVLDEADLQLIERIARRSIDAYHESLEGRHGPPGGDPDTWRAMDAARQVPVRADLEQAWYHIRRYDRLRTLLDLRVLCPSCFQHECTAAATRGEPLPLIRPGRTTSNPTAHVVVHRLDRPAQIRDYERRGACDRCGPHAGEEVG